MRGVFGAGVVAAFVTLVGAASGTGTPTLSASQHAAGLAAVEYGKSLKLSGHEALGGSKPFVLQAEAFPFKTGFKTVAHGTTKGSYSVAVSPTHATRYRIMVGGAASPTLTVYVLYRQKSLSCNLCHANNPPGTHTLVISETLQAPPGPIAVKGPEYLYYAQAAAMPSTLRLVKQVPLHVQGNRLSYQVSYTVHFPATAFSFQYSTCFKDAESTDGVGLPGLHHCGDATIKRGQYLG